MIYGLNQEGKRISAAYATKLEKQKYFCPCCNSELVLKNGKINSAHFAHKNLSDCDTFTQDMSEWHKAWQEQFPEKYREVVITLKLNEFEYNWAAYNFNFYTGPKDKARANCSNTYLSNKKKMLTIKHRADVCINGYVIEFQHSPISTKEFNERNWFYTKAGYKVIWIFDFIEEFKNEQIKSYDEWNKEFDHGAKYSWDNCKKIFKNFIPQESKNIKILFQIKEPENQIDNYFLKDRFTPKENFLCRVVWAIEEENKESNFKRFFMSFKPKNKDDFKKMILEKKL